MKHLLNNLSEEEKNSIREQHEGGMKLDTSRFRTLLESKLGNVKPLVESDEEEDDFGYATHDGSFDGDDSEESEEKLNDLQRFWLYKLEKNPHEYEKYGMSEEEFKNFIYNEISTENGFDIFSATFEDMVRNDEEDEELDLREFDDLEEDDETW